MTDSPQLAALALNEIGRLLSKLTAEQLADLAEGRASVEFRPGDGTPAAPRTSPSTLTSPPSRTPARKPAKPSLDLDVVAAEIRAMTEEDAVERYLAERDKELPLPLLKDLADRIGPPVTSKGAKSKAQLRKNIAAGTAGLLNRPASVFAGSWDN